MNEFSVAVIAGGGMGPGMRDGITPVQQRGFAHDLMRNGPNLNSGAPIPAVTACRPVKFAACRVDPTEWAPATSDASAAEMTEHFVKLSCGNCGSEVEAYDDVERFACGHCAAAIEV